MVTLGGERLGGTMPAFDGKLNAEQIDAILAWGAMPLVGQNLCDLAREEWRMKKIENYKQARLVQSKNSIQRLIKLILVVLLFGFSVSAVAKDERVQVQLPEPMREHMLSNMRDHLLALETITRDLAAGEFDAAAETAESRLGMSSLESHGASHIARFMPEGMSTTGTAMHRAASRFAIKAKDAAVEGGLAAAFGALSDVMQQCVACHSGYRVH